MWNKASAVYLMIGGLLLGGAAGCETMKDNPRTTGTIGGAVGGAAIGAAVADDEATGAVIGGAAGAVGGNLAGKAYKDSQEDEDDDKARPARYREDDTYRRLPPADDDYRYYDDNRRYDANDRYDDDLLD